LRFAFFDPTIQSAAHWIRKRNRAKPAYLDPNSQSMQKPVEGLSVLALFPIINRQAKVEPIYRGAIDCREHNSPQRINNWLSETIQAETLAVILGAA
jgi:hypothetical protein